LNVKVKEPPCTAAEPAGSETAQYEVEHVGPLTLSGRIQSLRYAGRGVRLMLRTQHNAWLHAVASCCVLIVGGLFVLSATEWCWIVLAIMAVWTAEALNTALELLADVASPEFHPLVGQAKDVAAGGVLISAGGSVIIAALIFGPHVLKLFGALE
jgi:diacylglycerol kinase (ATP)